jgi:hypothetical protein
MRLKRALGLLTVWLLVGTGGPRAFADLFDAAKDFSTASNPNGVWSYGTTGTTPNGPFTSFSNVGLALGGVTGWNGWLGTESEFGDEFPFVSKNTTNMTLTPPNVVLLPGELVLHPAPDAAFGGDGAYAVVRFTAPTAGAFSLNAVFEGRAPTEQGFPDGTTTDVHVLLNGTSLFDGAVSGFGPSSDQVFPTTLNLHVGDHLDFAVGIGSDGSFLNDSTGLAAALNSVPEPSTLGPTVIGMTALAIAGWRRRSSRCRAASD